VAFGRNPGAREDVRYRAGNDASVQQQAPRVNILDVTIELLLPIDVVATTHLSQTGYPRPNLMPPCLAHGIPRKVPHEKRPWAHHAHVPPQNIPQSGELVETRGTQPTPEGGEAILVVYKTSSFIDVFHAPKLVQPENLGITTGSLLPKNHRRTEPGRDRDGRNEKHR
jgi:hypothetical protein